MQAPTMISVAEAKNLISSHVRALPTTWFDLKQCGGYTLAADVFSPGNFPPFRQSSMDGYAFAFKDWGGTPLLVNGEMQAGGAEQIRVERKQAVRIFTGAPVPDGLDTVVMQEKTSVTSGWLTINDDQLTQHTNVRQAGSEIQAQALALQKGTLLTPAAIGFVAGLGLTQMEVITKPKVMILVTGKELQQPGHPLQYGQVYESNSYALTAALHHYGIDHVSTSMVDDDPAELKAAIEQALAEADLLLLTGGVSVGDYDFVAGALAQCGVETIFHKIKQRPGKPLLFGKKADKVIFGLPGNPSSVLTCFYEYVLLALEQLTMREPFLQNRHVPLAQDYNKAKGLTHFLKGTFQNGEARLLTAQESYRMSSFATANCLLVFDQDREKFSKGEMIEMHQFT